MSRSIPKTLETHFFLCQGLVMKIGLLTNEYPPQVYGGAGVHLEYLVREMAGLEGNGNELKIIYFGKKDQYSGNISVQGCPLPFSIPTDDPRLGNFLNVLFKELLTAASMGDGDVIHCHTWYTHLAGCL